MSTLPADRRTASRTCADPLALALDAVWRGDPRPATDTELEPALALARSNQVEGRLARAYPRQLADVLADVRDANDSFRQNLWQVTEELRAAGIPAVLIKADLNSDYVYGNFDLVVRDRDWDATSAALSVWYAYTSRYWLERSTKILLEPTVGPAVHLHRAVSWFGVPVIPTERLFEQAVPDGPDGCLIPDRPGQLRIWLAHAVFQNLAFDLSELLALVDLLHPDVIHRAIDEAENEGWRTGFAGALAVAQAAISRLDDGDPVRLPVPLRTDDCVKVGAEHTLHLLRTGRRGTAAREAALRLPLIIAKKRRMLRA
jgi:hypothetical protein